MTSKTERRYRCRPVTALAAAAACALALGLMACPDKPLKPAPKDGRYVDVGGYSVFYRDSGEPAAKQDGSPTIVLLSGLNDNLKVWDKVYARLEDRYRVIAYDRGGVGWSDEGMNPRTGSVVSDELAELLWAIDAEPPYVLCAHSFGGQFARLFIRDFPADVVGLVLIDTTHEDQYDRQALLLEPRTAQRLMNISMLVEDAMASTGAIGEWVNRNNTFAETRASRYLPDIPLYFLGQDYLQFSFLPDDQRTAASELELNLYQDMAELTPRGILEVVPGVGHDIHVKAPDKVVEAIEAVVTGEGF